LWRRPEIGTERRHSWWEPLFADSRKLAQDIASEVETALDGVALTLAGHVLVNLRLTFWTVAKSNEIFGAVMKFRAASEPV
jgi:hypothetical protein